MAERLLEELAGPVEKLVNRHLEAAHEWYPHETTPWSEARNFTDHDPWHPDEHHLKDGVRSALYVNLLTEDNLPYYTAVILNQSDPDHPLNEWARLWTAEEGRHAMAIRDWILATRAFDPKLLEDGRMVQMAGGQVPQPESLADMLAYTSFQELATRVAHNNTGKKLGKERGGQQVMARVAADENLHYNFYSGVVVEALEIDPSTMMIAICEQLRDFDMPGTGIPNFAAHKIAIAREGIYDGQQHLENVVLHTLERWNIEAVTGLSDEAKKARDGIFRRIGALTRAASAQAARFAEEKSIAGEPPA